MKFVKGMKAAPMLSEDVLQNAGDLMKKMDLTAIEECSEDEDDSDIKTSNDNSNSFSAFTPFTQFEVAQAFSHFSYFATGRKRLICDLQGVYNECEFGLEITFRDLHDLPFTFTLYSTVTHFVSC